MAHNVNDWYTDVLYRLRGATEQPSRNGRVKCVLTPTLWTVMNPKERVLFCPERRCNPYLHVMETVWMFAGAKNVEFLLPFSKQMGAYAELDNTINGAYGHRWRNHFYRDQIMGAIDELQRDPDSRQCVIAMYDPRVDFSPMWKDRPCNTHIYLRIVGGALDMTVCNRSNDAVWGMTGANAVHMTYLQELIAVGLKIPVGIYYVMTNNLHIYEQHWPLLEAPLSFDHYNEQHSRGVQGPYPLMGPNESDVYEFMQECESFVVNDVEGYYKSDWINNVVIPMYEHYMCRLNGDKYSYDINETMATDWRMAEKLWQEWNV